MFFYKTESIKNYPWPHKSATIIYTVPIYLIRCVAVEGKGMAGEASIVITLVSLKFELSLFIMLSIWNIQSQQ